MAARAAAIVIYTSISYMMGAAGYAPYIAANAAITGLDPVARPRMGAARASASTPSRRAGC